ncbi:MAG: PQQ-binding-like beta-propeller repeat protein [Haloferacaceae archaeon]
MGVTYDTYQFDHRHTGYHPDTSGPRGDISVRWQKGFKGAVSESLAVSADTVYAGVDGGYLYALERTNGSGRWIFEAPPLERDVSEFDTADGDIQFVDDVTVGGPVLYEDGVLWAVSGGEEGPGAVFSVAGGERRWKYDVSDWGVTSPVLVGDRAYLTENYLHSLTSGESEFEEAAAKVHGIYAKSEGRSQTEHHNFVGMFNEVNQLLGEGPTMSAAPDGTVYLQTLNKLTAFDSGGRQWEAQVDASQFDGGVPIVGDGAVYWTVDGTLHSHDASIGTENWSVDVPARNRQWYGALAEDRLYSVSSGTVVCLGAQTGSELWTYDLTEADAPLPFDDVTAATPPTVVGGRVYVGFGQYLPRDDDVDDAGVVVALDCGDGAEAWRFAVDGAPNTPPAVVDGVVYLGTRDGDVGSVYALEGDDEATAEGRGATASAEGASSERDPDAGSAEGASSERGTDADTGETASSERGTDAGSAEAAAEGPSCPNCAAALSGEEKFCPECGHDLRTPECPSCGNELSGEESFCPECGTKLD